MTLTNTTVHVGICINILIAVTDLVILYMYNCYLDSHSLLQIKQLIIYALVIEITHWFIVYCLLLLGLTTRYRES